MEKTVESENEQASPEERGTMLSQGKSPDQAAGVSQNETVRTGRIGRPVMAALMVLASVSVASAQSLTDSGADPNLIGRAQDKVMTASTSFTGAGVGLPVLASGTSSLKGGCIACLAKDIGFVKPLEPVTGKSAPPPSRSDVNN